MDGKVTNKKRNKIKIIALVLIAVVVVILISIALTRAFMKPVVSESAVTTATIETCANIKITDSGSIDLNNSFPMTKNAAFNNVKPYKLSIDLVCGDKNSFSIYLGALQGNTLESSNIHYMITNRNDKNVLSGGDGVLSTVTNKLTSTDITEFEAGSQGTINTKSGSKEIYSLYTGTLTEGSTANLDLYLFIDENIGNSTMNKTFKAAIGVKAE